MIQRFLKVNDNIYRGSAPSVDDVVWMKENLGINKIISLDEISGKNIDKICKMLGIKHIIIPLNHKASSFFNLFKYNIKDLLEKDGPTFVHCLHGKDRTSVLVAIYKTRYLGVPYKTVLREAEKIGMGLGCTAQYFNLLKKIIKASSKQKDINDANYSEINIVDNVRDELVEMEAHKPLSLAPYADPTKHPVYNSNYDQSGIRGDVDPGAIKENINVNISAPQVGLFNNDSGIRGVGPVEIPGGFVYQ